MTRDIPPPGPSRAYQVVPKLGELRDAVVYGDVWERTELSKRDRSLITVAMLAALYRSDELQGHVGRALNNGVTPDEIREVNLQTAFYSGWPCAVNAARIAGDVFEERGIS